MSKDRSFHVDGQKFSNNGGGNTFTPTGNTGTSSYHSNTTNRGGDGSRSGGGGEVHNPEVLTIGYISYTLETLKHLMNG